MPRLPMSKALAALATAGSTLAAATAAAQQPTGDCAPRPPASAPLGSVHADVVDRCIVADDVWPRAGDSPWLALGPALVTPPGEVSFGLSLALVSRPVVVDVPSADPDGARIYVVDHRLGITTALALGVGERVELTLAAPAVLFQDGAGVSDLIGSSEDELPTSAVGDLRFGTGVAVVEREATTEGPALAARLELVAPTGTRSAFASAGQAAFVPAVVYDHRVGVGSWGVEIGARLRPVARRFGGSTLQHQLLFAAGGSVEAVDEAWLSFAAELYALVGLSPRDEGGEQSGAVEVPAEWYASARTAHFLDRRLALSLGGGGWLPTAASAPLGAPRFRLGFDVEYSFEPPPED